MKKAKIMLSVIFIFSIVGGAFALKASNTTGLKYCTGTIDATICPNLLTMRLFVAESDETIAVKYVEIGAGQNCNNSPACTLTGTSAAE